MEKPTPAQPAAIGRSRFGNQSEIALALAGVAAASAPPHEETQNGQLQPAAGAGVQHAYHSPNAGADQKAHLQADNVDQPAADRLKHRVGQLE